MIREGDYDYVSCPLVDGAIDRLECLETMEAVDRTTKEAPCKQKFRRKGDWRLICRQCPQRKAHYE